MPGPAFLRGERLALHTIEQEDHEFIHTYWNNPVIRDGAVRPTPLLRDDVSEWITPARGIHFLVCLDDTPVGTALLIDIFPEAGNGELGYWIVPDHQGKGYATEAADLCLRHAFYDRRLHKVIARTFSDNEASQRVLAKLGFEQEGTLREQHYIDGEYRDMNLYGLLRSNWENTALRMD